MRVSKNDKSDFLTTVEQLQQLQKQLEKQLSILKKYLSFLETEADSEENRRLCDDLIKKTEECLKAILLLNELNDDLTLLTDKDSAPFGSQRLGKDLRICPYCGRVQRHDHIICMDCGTILDSVFMPYEQQAAEGESGQSKPSGMGNPNEENGSGGAGQPGGQTVPSSGGFGQPGGQTAHSSGGGGQPGVQTAHSSGGFGQSGSPFGESAQSYFPFSGDAQSGSPFGGFGQSGSGPGGSKGDSNRPYQNQHQGQSFQREKSVRPAYNSPGQSLPQGSTSIEPAARKTSNPVSALGRILAAPFTAAGSLLKGIRDKKDVDPELFRVEKVKEEETSKDTNNEITVSNVEFSAIAPAKMKKGEYSIINILMYEEEYRNVADRILSQSEEKNVETPGGAMDISHSSKIRVTLYSPDIMPMPVHGNYVLEEERVWTGKYQNFSFSVDIPGDYKKRQILFEVGVYINNVIASNLSFTADVDAEKEQRLSIQRKDILSAFVSYAREDRLRVLSIVQGMRQARRDLDIFMDVKDLRSGDEWEKVLEHEIADRDIFYLCWSIAASKSKNVEKEWRYALSCKGLDCIEPVPIDPPELCPPPDELKKKHFNDTLLYFIEGYGWNRR